VLFLESSIGILFTPGYPYYRDQLGFVVYGIYYPVLPYPNTPQTTVSQFLGSRWPGVFLQGADGFGDLFVVSFWEGI